MTSNIVKLTALFRSGKVTIPGRHELVRFSPYLQILHSRGEYNLVVVKTPIWTLGKFRPVPICGILWIFYDPRGRSSENVPPATCDGLLPALSSGRL